ncbi:MAG: 1-acyl-sn-glycerol-3-phosphate acyltransferase [Bacteroidales bacterium]|nr:1-acyl-sn-glycerol-3-phosphate acyltransferase [Bacteroidales bacterium]
MDRPIQDFNLTYTLLKPLVKFAFRCHYNSVTIRGRKKLPAEGGYILAPNHQQALMEPLAILCVTRRPTVFLARADIFEKPAMRAFFTFLKILPIYRIRDGRESLAKDAGIFEQSRNAVLDGYPLCLMAEGRHNDKHQLLPLVKGMFRIAGETQRRMGDKPLYIVPVGVDFDEYEQPYSNLVVNIGEPIAVKQYMAKYEENEAVALNQMRSAVAAAMSKQMHDIKSKEHYEEINTLCNIENKYWRRYDRKTNTPWHRFHVRRALAGKYDSIENSLTDPLINQTTNSTEVFNKTMHKTREYQKRCRDLKVSEKLSSEHYGFWMTLLYTLIVGGVVTAMCLVGWVRWILFFCLLCFPIQYLPLELIPKKTVKDTQFRSSFSFGIKFAVSIVYVIAFAIVCGCTGGMWLGSRLEMAGVSIGNGWWGLIGFGMAFPLAAVGGKVYTYFRRLIASWYYWILRTFRTRDFRQPAALREELCK